MKLQYCFQSLLCILKALTDFKNKYGELHENPHHLRDI